MDNADGLLEETGSPEHIENVMRTLLRFADPDDYASFARCSLASALNQLGDYAEARSLYEKESEDISFCYSSHHMDYLLLLFLRFPGPGSAAMLVEILESILRTTMSSGGTDLSASVHLMLAQIHHYKRSDYEVASFHYQQARAAARSWVKITELALASAHFHSHYLRDSAVVDECISSIDAHAIYCVADVALNAGEYPARFSPSGLAAECSPRTAQLRYESAVKIDPPFPLFINYGVFLFEKGDCEAAIVQFARALAIDSDSAEAHWQLASIYSAQHRQQDALMHLHEVFRINPAHFRAHERLAELHKAAGREELAAYHESLARRARTQIETDCLKRQSQASTQHEFRVM